MDTLAQLGITQEDLAKQVVAAVSDKVVEWLVDEQEVESQTRQAIRERIMESTEMSFREYLVLRAEEYLKEPVNFKGHTRAEDRYGHGWKAGGTRIEYMINQHLQYSISTAMKAALENANSAIVGGIEAAVKIKLAEISKSLKITVKT